MGTGATPAAHAKVSRPIPGWFPLRHQLEMYPADQGPTFGVAVLDERVPLSAVSTEDLGHDSMRLHDLLRQASRQVYAELLTVSQNSLDIETVP